MELKVGKKYRNRIGNVVTIVGRSNCDVFPFKGDDDYSYKTNGCWNAFDELDLVEEVCEAKKPDPLFRTELIHVLCVKAADAAADPLLNGGILDEVEATGLWDRIYTEVDETLRRLYR